MSPFRIIIYLVLLLAVLLYSGRCTMPGPSLSCIYLAKPWTGVCAMLFLLVVMLFVERAVPELIPAEPAVWRVAQRDSHGCAIACVAMVTGRGYEELRAMVVAAGYDPQVGGLDAEYVVQMLWCFGYCSMPLYCTDLRTNRLTEPWPLKPYAPAHLCCVETAHGTHMVVWLPDGRVLDPDQPGEHQLGDYEQVHYIISVFPKQVF